MKKQQSMFKQKYKIPKVRRNLCTSQLVCSLLTAIGFVGSYVLAVESSILGAELGLKSPDFAGPSFWFPAVTVVCFVGLVNSTLLCTHGHKSARAEQPQVVTLLSEIAAVSTYSQACYFWPGVVIFMLLLMSGDVELNPGPGNRGKPQEKERNAGNEDYAVRKETTPFQVTEHCEDVNVSRDPIATVLTSPNPQHQDTFSTGPDVACFPALGDDVRAPTDSSPRPGNVEKSSLHDAEWAVERQKYEKELQRVKQRVKELEDQNQEKGGVIDNLKSKIAALEKKNRLLEQKSTQNEGELEVKQSWETFRSSLNALRMELGQGQEEATAEDNILMNMFKVLYETVHSYLGPKYEHCIEGKEEKYRGRLQELMSCFMKELNNKQLWNEETGFQMDSSMSQVLFLVTANQLYRIGGNCEVCPLCGIKKKHRRNSEKEGDPDSHIFPKSLLLTFRDVHCDSAGTFIWDWSLSRKFGAGKLSIKLLCQQCESLASDEERKLRDLYVHILSWANKRITVPNEGEWLSFIFVNIMFRGLVSSVNLIDIVHSRQFECFKALFTLQNYSMKRGQNRPRLYLYILPNGPFNFNTELQDAAYIFNLQIRNPQFTLIVKEKEGTFLYTKFDCFHCVLPLVDCNKCFEKVSVSGHITIPSEEQRKHQFPQVLLRRNLDEAVQLAKHIISQLPHSQLDHHCKVFISQAPSIHHQYSQNIQWQTTEDVGVPSESPYQFNERACYGKQELRELIEKAAEASPLKPARVGQTIHNKENTQLKEQIRKLQGELDKKKQELKTVRKDLEQEKQLRKEAQKAVERLTRAVHVDKKNLNDLQAELQETQKEIQELNKPQPSHLHLVELAQERDFVQPIQETNIHASSELVTGHFSIAL